MDKRFFLALLLSLIVVALSQLLFPVARTTPKAAPAAPAATTAAPASGGAAVQSTVQPAAAIAPATDSGRAQPKIVETHSSIQTDKSVYTFTNIGAAPLSAVMLEYANRSPGDGKVELAARDSKLLRYGLALPSDTVSLEKVAFDAKLDHRADGTSILTYTTTVRANTIRIAYTSGAGPYSLKVTGSVTGVTAGAYLVVSLPSTLRASEADTNSDQRSLGYVFKRTRDRPGSVPFGKLDPGEKRLETGPLDWVAVKNKYFVFGLVSDKNPFTEVSFVGGARTSKIATHAEAAIVQSLPQGAFSFVVYAGPQETTRLAAMGKDFDHVNPYGWKFLQPVVHPVASLVIQILLWMHNALQLSYGWVLIILGLVVRLVLWPLNQSTMRSTLRMQAVQPKLEAAKKRHKDPKQQQEAIMRVYQEEGISPLAPLIGCLPALLPMPVFFALFFVFQNTIEFRGVPFLWLHDLSTKDPLYLIPLLMGVSMYVLSWIGMRNAPPNPQTKMMGYMFPVMMTVLLLNMASGLNLYYTAQNLAALPQQWLLSRERLRASSG